MVQTCESTWRILIRFSSHNKNGLFDGGKGGSESRPFIVYKIQSEDEDSSFIFEYKLVLLSSPLYKGYNL